MDKNEKIISFGRSYNPPNWFCNPNYLANRIYYIISGIAYYKQKKQLNPGSIYLFPSSRDFSVSQDKSCPVDHVYFDFYTNYTFSSEEYIEIAVIKNSVPDMLCCAMAEDFKNEPDNITKGEAYFTLLMEHLKPYINTYKIYCEITVQTLNAIHRNDPAKLSVANIAKNTNVNINHMIRCFKNDMGITPHKYIALYKMELASSMIIQGYQIKAVAEILGFQSVSAFSTFFKHESSQSPTEYKLNHSV